MRVKLVATAPVDIAVDALAVPVATGQRPSGDAGDLDRALGGLLSELLTKAGEYGEAGAILGGMFIGEFTRGKPWTHLYIAASSSNTNNKLTTVLRGPSSAGTRICIELAELMAGAAR